MGKKLTTVAIAYDFDGTLAKGNIQENSYIPEQLNMSKNDFWTEVRNHAKMHQMDEILAYMYLLLFKAKGKDASYTKRTLRKHGKSVKYFSGVKNYFKLINDYAKTKGIKIAHYIISSGTKEMIEGTDIARYFDYIFASSFMYDANDVPQWPAIAINYTNKTQFLFRINKGIQDISDNQTINEYMPESERPIPFSNIIYIGDGLTDVPAMKLVKSMGGNSIGVYDSEKKGTKTKVELLLRQDRVNYVVPANYDEGSPLIKIIKSIIDRIASIASVKEYSKRPKKHEKDLIKKTLSTSNKKTSIVNE